MKECVPYAEFIVVRNVKENIEALLGFSIHIFCSSFFSIHRTLNYCTIRDLLS